MYVTRFGIHYCGLTLQSVCLAACEDIPIKHFISKLMTEPHWLILSTSHGLNFQTHRYRLGCALTIKFTAFLFFNINDVLY